MTALGAAFYGGFFALAALWLFLTGDEPDDADNRRWVQDRSNSTKRAVASESIPMLVSSQK